MRQSYFTTRSGEAFEPGLVLHSGIRYLISTPWQRGKHIVDCMVRVLGNSPLGRPPWIVLILLAGAPSTGLSSVKPEVRKVRKLRKSSLYGISLASLRLLWCGALILRSAESAVTQFARFSFLAALMRPCQHIGDVQDGDLWHH
jgi:hypothetical protein